MSATHCPFDGDVCQKKQLRFNAWQKAIIQNNGIAFQINPDMFADCAIDSAEEREKLCERYQRYLFIVKNTQNNLAQEHLK